MWTVPLSLAVGLVTAAAVQPLSQQLVGSRPNVLILFVDDFGWGDVHANWPAFNDTPNIDAKLVQRGMRFTDFHAMSVCSPSRASLLTGRYGIRNGVVTNFSPLSLYGLPLNETTLPELLQATYHTAMTGKFHLGIQPAYNPVNRYGCTNVNYTRQPLTECPNYATDRCMDYGNPRADPAFCHIGPNNPWKESIPLFHNFDIVEQPVNLQSLTARYADFAIDFIRNATQLQDKPWFLYQAFNHMHVPVTCASQFHGSSNSSSKTEHGPAYGDALRELDYHIGRVLDTLDELAIASNTLIFFTGDNGGPSGECEWGGSNGPFNGTWLRLYGGGGNTGKQTTWEGGHREATVISWPGRIPAGTVSDVLGSTLDIFPTVAALANVSLPVDRVYDGVDLSPVLFDGAMVAHEWLVHPNCGEGPDGEIETIRVGDYKAKYRYLNVGGCAQWPASQMGKGGQHRLDQPLIFNLAHDPSEAAPLPESGEEYQTALSRILAAWTQFNASLVTDKRSRANYTEDSTCTAAHCIKPCCNRAHPLCEC